MFSMCLVVCILAIYFIRPNEAIFGLDALIERVAADVATNNNNDFQSAFTQGIQTFRDLQNSLQNTTTSLNPQISAVMNDSIAAAVARAGGSPGKIANCTAQHQASLASFEMSTANTIVNACMSIDIHEATSVLNIYSSLANNLTKTIVDANKTVAATCPAASPGDWLGGVTNARCVVTTFGLIAGNLAFQTYDVRAQLSQVFASDRERNVSLCVQNQMLALPTDAASVIDPVVKCSIAP